MALSIDVSVKLNINMMLKCVLFVHQHSLISTFGSGPIKIHLCVLFGITISVLHGHEKTSNIIPQNISFGQCNVWKHSGSLHLIKFQPETRSQAQVQGLPCWTPTIWMSLNDAFLARYIPHDHARNQCQVTTIDIMDRKNPSFALGVFYSKLGSSTVNFGHQFKHQFCPRNGILH